MKVKDIKDLIVTHNLHIDPEDLDVDLLVELEHYFFRNPRKDEDYRVSALRYCIGLNKKIRNTVNNAHGMIKDYVVLKCPKCKRNMIPGDGGGNNTVYGVSYKCPGCGAKGHINLHYGDLGFSFPDKEK